MVIGEEQEQEVEDMKVTQQCSKYVADNSLHPTTVLKERKLISHFKWPYKFNKHEQISLLINNKDFFVIILILPMFSKL